MALTSPPATRVAAINRYLLPSEQVRIQVRRHWAEMFWPGVAVFAGLVVAMLLDTVMPLVDPVRIVLWLAWGAVLAYFIWRIIEWSLDWFVVTDKRFVLAQGVFTRKVGMMPLARVTDMSYQRTTMGRVLGYGKFVLESAGQDQALSSIDFLPDPDVLYREVGELLFHE